MVTMSQCWSIAVRNPRAGAMAGRPRRWPRRNSSSTFSGRPRSMFSRSSASKNARAWTSPSKTRVREVSICRMARAHPALDPPRPRAGAKPVADPREGVRVVAGGEPVGQRGETDPGGGRLPLGPLVPVEPDLDRIREVGADLDEPRPHLLVKDVNVKH